MSIAATGVNGAVTLTATSGFNNTLTDTGVFTTTVLTANVTLVKTASPSNPQPGDTVTYTIQYQNTGNDMAYNAVIKDAIPSGATYVSNSLLAGATAGSATVRSDLADGDNADFNATTAGSVTHTVGSVAAGASGVLIFRVTIGNLTEGTAVSNIAQTFYETPSGNARGPFDSPPSVVTVSAEAAVTLGTSGSRTGDPSDTVVYPLTVTNSGNAPAVGLVVEDTLPLGLQFVSSTPTGTLAAGTIRWQLASLAAGSASAFSLRVRVPEAEREGASYSNVGRVSAQGLPPTSSNPLTAVVAPGASLSVIKRALQTVVSPGANLEFVLDYANLGNVSAVAAELADALPQGTEFVSSTPAATVAAGVVRIPLGDLTAGSRGSARLVVRVLQGTADNTRIRNVALLTARGGLQTESNEVFVNVMRALVANIELVAEPPVILANGTDFSVLTARVFLSDGTPAPDGTPVTFRTPVGVFTGGQQTVVVSTVGGIARTRLTANFSGTVPIEALATATAGSPITGLASDDVRILFSPAGVRGVLRRADGTPVPGATVVLETADGTEVARLVTDSSGGYTLPVGLTGSYRVRIVVTSARGTAVSLSGEVTVSSLFGAVFSPLASLAGTLLERSSGQPIAGCDIVLFRLDPAAPGGLREQARSQTGSAGEYVFDGLPLGEYQLEAGDCGPAERYPVAPRRVSLADAGEMRLDADLFVDPSGFVYDGATNDRIRGATVTLLDAATGNPVRLPAPGGGPSLNPSLTDDRGVYVLTPPPGSYVLTVTAAGYQPYRSPILTVTTAPIGLQIPLVPDILRITKLASKTVVSPGDLLSYQVAIENLSSAAIAGLVVQDTPPVGFTYVNGSATVGSSAIPDPAPGSSLSFAVGAVGPRSRALLTYRLAVGPGALRSRGVNSAVAIANIPGGTLRAGPAQAAVEIIRGVFYEESLLIGRVYADLDADGRFGRGDRPVPGARVYVEDGTSVLTDPQGHFSIEGLTPERHVVMLDPLSVPGGPRKLRPVKDGWDTLGEPWSHLTVARNGTLVRVDFPLVPAPGFDVTKVLPAAAASHSTTSASLSVRTTTAGSLDSLASVARQAGPVAKTVSSTAAADAHPATTALALILEPADGAPASQGHVPIKVFLAQGLTGELRVNGKPIPETQIGVRSVDNRRKTSVLTYISVSLDEGANRLEYVARDPFGNERARCTSRVHLVAGPARLEISAEPEQLVADARSRGRVRIAVRDAGGFPVRDNEVVTVVVTGARVSSADVDPGREGLQVRTSGGTATLELEPSTAAGSFEVVAFAGAAEQRQLLRFGADLRKPIVLGVGSLEFGRRGVNRPSGDFALTRDLEPGSFTRSRAAFFAKGRVFDDVLLTMSLDTAKDTRQRLFRDLDIDRFYPLYGDSSRIDRDAESADKLYLRLDREDDYLLYGDYQTGFLDLELAGYNRRMTGLKGEFREGDVELAVLASETDQRQVRDIIRGGGNSGPYFLSGTNVMIGSEQVRIEVRDRRFVELVREARTLVRNVDYTINYFDGTLLFKEPVTYESSAFEPVFIVANYEVRPGSGGPRQRVLGGRGRLHLGRDLTVGATRVTEDDRQEDFELQGVDLTLKLNRFRLDGEYAETQSLSAGDGNGYKLHLQGPLGDHWKLDALYRNLDDGYRNLSNAVGDAGEERFGLTLEGKPDSRSRYLASYVKRRNGLRGESTDGASVTALRELEPGLSMTAGVEKLQQTLMNGISAPGTLANPRSFNDFPALSQFPLGTAPSGDAWTGRLGLEKKAGSRIRLKAEREQPLSGSRSIQPVGNTLTARYRMTEEVDLVAASRWEDFGPFDRALHSLGMETRISDDTFAYSRYVLRNQEQGLENFASYGVKTRHQLTNQLGASVNYERSSGLDSTAPTDFQAYGVALAYVPGQPENNATVRFEKRFGASGFQNLAQLGVGYRLGGGHSLLGKLIHTETGGTVTRDRDQDRLESIVAWAYRPYWMDWLDVLLQYRHRDETTGLLGLSADGGADILSLDLHLRPEDGLWLAFRHAVKLSTDRTGGMESELQTQLNALRLQYEFAPRFDVALEGRRLSQDATGQSQFGLGLELGYEVMRHVRVAGGYNFSGFEEPDLTSGEYTAKGPVVRVDFKLTRF